MNDSVDRPTPRRGWSSQDLPVVAPDDNRYWSVYDMTELFGTTDKKVRALIELGDLKHVGKRHNGAKKRHVPVYLAAEVLSVTQETVERLLSGSTKGQPGVSPAQLLI
jgi:hypothetical protein